jgi:hypothetical protein
MLRLGEQKGVADPYVTSQAPDMVSNAQWWRVFFAALDRLLMPIVDEDIQQCCEFADKVMLEAKNRGRV